MCRDTGTGARQAVTQLRAGKTEKITEIPIPGSVIRIIWTIRIMNAPRCGARFKDDGMRCPECGARFDGTENDMEEYYDEEDEEDMWDEEDGL